MRRIQALLQAHAVVTVVAPWLSPEVEVIGTESQVTVARRRFRAADLAGVFLAVAASDDPAVNKLVATLARERGVLVNSVDDASACDMIFPAVVRRGDVQIAITTGGRVPALSRHLRGVVERAVPAEYEGLGALLAQLRAELLADNLRVDAETWQRAIDRRLLNLVKRGELGKAMSLARKRLKPDARAP